MLKLVSLAMVSTHQCMFSSAWAHTRLFLQPLALSLGRLIGSHKCDISWNNRSCLWAELHKDKEAFFVFSPSPFFTYSKESPLEGSGYLRDGIPHCTPMGMRNKPFSVKSLRFCGESCYPNTSAWVFFFFSHLKVFFFLFLFLGV